MHSVRYYFARVADRVYPIDAFHLSCYLDAIYSSTLRLLAASSFSFSFDFLFYSQPELTLCDVRSLHIERDGN